MPTTNLGEGFGFHYSPELDEARPTNFDTPEYAHIVATTLLYHREAVAAGMRPLPAADRRAPHAAGPRACCSATGRTPAT